MILWTGLRGEQWEDLFLGTASAVGYGGWSWDCLQGPSEQMGLGPWPLPLRVPDVSFKTSLFVSEMCQGWARGQGRC